VLQAVDQEEAFEWWTLLRAALEAAEAGLWELLAEEVLLVFLLRDLSPEVQWELSLLKAYRTAVEELPEGQEV
jgi:hypothetical protein